MTSIIPFYIFIQLLSLANDISLSKVQYRGRQPNSARYSQPTVCLPFSYRRLRWLLTWISHSKNQFVLCLAVELFRFRTQLKKVGRVRQQTLDRILAFNIVAANKRTEPVAKPKVGQAMAVLKVLLQYSAILGSNVLNFQIYSWCTSPRSLFFLRIEMSSSWRSQKMGYGRDWLFFDQKESARALETGLEPIDFLSEVSEVRADRKIPAERIRVFTTQVRLTFDMNHKQQQKFSIKMRQSQRYSNLDKEEHTPCLPTTYYTNSALSMFARPKPSRKLSLPLSASILCHQQLSFSFTKDKRFRTRKSDCSAIVSIDLPSTKTKRSCSFGKGKRRPIDPHLLRCSSQVPDPGSYELRQKLVDSNKGKSFGLSWIHYKNIYNPHKKQVHGPESTENNPPAIYDVIQPPGQNKKKFTIYGRLKMFNQLQADKKKHVPGHIYNPGQQKLGWAVSQGKGNRIDFSKPLNQNPGPHYQIKGFCQK